MKGRSERLSLISICIALAVLVVLSSSCSQSGVGAEAGSMNNHASSYEAAADLSVKFLTGDYTLAKRVLPDNRMLSYQQQAEMTRVSIDELIKIDYRDRKNMKSIKNMKITGYKPENKFIYANTEVELFNGKKYTGNIALLPDNTGLYEKDKTAKNTWSLNPDTISVFHKHIQ